MLHLCPMTISQLYEIFLRHPSVVTDTRELKQGDLFFALKGPNFNGNAFAVRALELGAAYAVIDEAPAQVSGSADSGAASASNSGAGAAASPRPVDASSPADAAP